MDARRTLDATLTPFATNAKVTLLTLFTTITLLTHNALGSTGTTDAWNSVLALLLVQFGRRDICILNGLAFR